ncbi:MAG: cytochrome bc complex cytochrome b subunit [Planctomycetota bacterium]
MSLPRVEPLRTWVVDRLALGPVVQKLRHKSVPAHRYSVAYFLGGMSLFFFLVQVATGILLMLYYRPSADGAFESVEFLMTTVSFGWLVRSLHSWSANLMVFVAAVHLTTVYFLRAYRRPRELTWVTGVLLLVLVMGFGFSGYLLPWNQLAFFATKVGTDIAGSVPVVGEWILRFLRGGDRVGGGTLSRFYGWHVAILPALTMVVLGVHLLLVQIHGMSVPPTRSTEAVRQRPMPFFPHYALRELLGWVLALGVLATLAALFPWELGDKADPFAPAYRDIKPEWYFMFMFQTLKLVPGGEILGVEYEAVPILLFGLGFLALLLVPFLEGRRRDGPQHPFARGIGIATTVFVVGMTAWGYASAVPIVIVLGTVAVLVLLGWITRHSPAVGRKP